MTQRKIRVLFVFLWLGSVLLIHSCGDGRRGGDGGAPPAEPDELSVDQQLRDLDILWQAISTSHAGFKRYESPQSLKNRFESLKRSVVAPSSRFDFLASVFAFNASTRSGHLYTIAKGTLAEEVLSQPRLPLFLKAIGDRLYLWRDVSGGDPIPIGAEILAINGRSTATILDKIYPHVPTDGFIETRKPFLLSKYRSPTYEGFDLYYALFVERPERFEVRYRASEGDPIQEVTLPGISFAEKKSRLESSGDDSPLQIPQAPSIRLLSEQETAILSIPRSWGREGDEDFDALLRRLVDQMHAAKIRALIIDVRGNEGGNDDHPSQVFRYLSEEGLRYYRGLFRRNVDFGPFADFFPENPQDRPPELDANWYQQDASGRYWSRLDDGPYHLMLPLEPFDHPFLGSVYVLADGGSFSSGAQLAALFLDRRRAILIGEETGGEYAGPDGGQTLPIRLPESEIQVRIPLIRSVNSFGPWPRGRGAVPHCRVSPSVASLLDESDPAMDLAVELIDKKITLETFDTPRPDVALPEACIH